MVFDPHFQRCPPQSGSNKHRGPYEYEIKSRLFHVPHRLRKKLLIDFKFGLRIEDYYILKILTLFADWTKSQFPCSYLSGLKIIKTKSSTIKNQNLPE